MSRSMRIFEIHFKLKVSINFSLCFMMLVFAAQAANTDVVKFQNIHGEPIQSLFKNCENHLYFSNSELGIKSIEVTGGKLVGNIGDKGIIVLAQFPETKIIVSTKYSTDTVVFRLRLAPLPNVYFNNIQIREADIYSISDSVKINLEVDSQFFAQCPHETLYVVSYNIEVIDMSIKKSIMSKRMIVTTGVNLIKLFDEWEKQDWLKSKKSLVVLFEPIQFLRKTPSGEFSESCSASLFFKLKVVE